MTMPFMIPQRIVKDTQEDQQADHHSEPKPTPAPEESAPIELEQPELENPVPDNQDEPVACQTSEHLKTYPLVQETSTFVNDFVITKAAKNTMAPFLKPVGEFIHSQSLLKPIVQTVDGVGVSTLKTVESFAPCLKTSTWNDALVTIKTPIVQTEETIKDVFTATNDCVENNIIAPTRKMVRDTRSYYNEKLYDTKGKPLLRSSLDPVFRPINYHLENFTLTNLPEGDPVMIEYSSEIERNVYLSMNFVERAIPVVENKIMDCVMIPCNYTVHAFEVYNENLNKTLEPSFNSSIKATYNTSIDLTNEAINETASLWKKVWNGNKSEAESEHHEEIQTTELEGEAPVHAVDPIPIVA